MSLISALRKRRLTIWEEAKSFVNFHRDENGLLSDEDFDTYKRMERKVLSLGRKIEFLEKINYWRKKHE